MSLLVRVCLTRGMHIDHVSVRMSSLAAILSARDLNIHVYKLSIRIVLHFKSVQDCRCRETARWNTNNSFEISSWELRIFVFKLYPMPLHLHLVPVARTQNQSEKIWLLTKVCKKNPAPSLYALFSLIWQRSLRLLLFLLLLTPISLL